MALESRKNKPAVTPATPAIAPVINNTKTTATRPASVLTVKPMESLFGTQNYILMAVGGVVIALGMLLMTGGKNPPNQFDYKLVYSTTRITVAPILILLGFAIEIVAIFRRTPVAAAKVA